MNKAAHSFRIEVTTGHEARFYEIEPQGNSRYKIFIEKNPIGTIQLDEKDHARCESVGCELDMPLLNAIRDEIQFHEDWKKI